MTIRPSCIFEKNQGCLPLSKKLRFSSIFREIEVVFQFKYFEYFEYLRSSSIVKKLRSSSLKKKLRSFSSFYRPVSLYPTALVLPHCSQCYTTWPCYVGYAVTDHLARYRRKHGLQTIDDNINAAGLGRCSGH
jgi:hypothetical protein